jgi:hypothetical protein
VSTKRTILSPFTKGYGRHTPIFEGEYCSEFPLNKFNIRVFAARFIVASIKSTDFGLFSSRAKIVYISPIIEERVI